MRPWTLRRIANRTLGNPRRIPFGPVRRPARSTATPVGPGRLDRLLAGVAGQLAVARLDQHAPARVAVAHHDGALLHAGERPVAAVGGGPEGPAHGGDAVAAAGAEAPVVVP